tara:strand:- start:1306 stop:2658 length:1353 start_codon:yes stop_codon:yes gene_type:complete
MNEIMLICAPVSSRSGYGAHARDLVHSFISLNKFDIKILDVRWGNTPQNALNIENKKDKLLMDRILFEPRLDRQPDVYVDIRIPNEFETHGKFNIGITAGIETDIISHKWIEGCNKMDLIIVPSEHSKRGIVETVYDKVQNTPDGKQQKIGDHKVQKPVEVLFEGADETIYKPLKADEIGKNIFDKINNIVKEDYALLFVGQWAAGEYGEDRKDIGKLIKVFYEAYANKTERPALILKTNGAGFSIMDKTDCLHKIKTIKDNFPTDFKLPNVYLLHGDLTDEEMNDLYNHPKIKAMVSFTHGEGFGRPLLEATMTGLPVITSGWSGHTDFLDTEKAVLLPGKIDKIPRSVVWDDILIPESNWFYVDENTAYNVFNSIKKNMFDMKRKAESLMNANRKKFTLNMMNELMGKILDKHLKSIPKAVGLTLPKLKKVSDTSKKQGIKLPKLKRI